MAYEYAARNYCDDDADYIVSPGIYFGIGTPSEEREILIKISVGRASPQRIFFLFLQ
jgi:hypothetical protein